MPVNGLLKKCCPETLCVYLRGDFINDIGFALGQNSKLWQPPIFACPKVKARGPFPSAMNEKVCVLKACGSEWSLVLQDDNEHD